MSEQQDFSGASGGDAAVALIRRARDLAAATASLCDQAIATITASAPHFHAAGESTDRLDYRRGRRPDGQLSDLGRKVACEFLKAGFADDATAKFMGMTPWGVGQLRRKWNLPRGRRKTR